MKVFYDIEVFRYDWCIVFKHEDGRIIYFWNDQKEELLRYVYNPENFEDNIYIGFNNRHYDTYVFSAILQNCDPYKVSQDIIKYQIPPYKVINNCVPFIQYDCMPNPPKSLKELEFHIGLSIQESTVSFDIDRKLTKEEREEVLKYCIHDVEATETYFYLKIEEFTAHEGLINIFNLNPKENYLKTKSQLVSTILGGNRTDTQDEWCINVPDNLKLNKYRFIADWFLNRSDINEKLEFNFNDSLLCTIANGGAHGGGLYVNTDNRLLKSADVESYYPSLIIEYGLMSRGATNNIYEEIKKQRVAYKKQNDPRHYPLKILLNSTYGSFLFKGSQLYDPLKGHLICIYGQLFLLDLMEQLEPYADIINLNTDGIIYSAHPGKEDKVKEVFDEWEHRTKMKLEHEDVNFLCQRDVNNYISIINNKLKSKGQFKQPTDTDCNLGVIPFAIKEYLVNHIPIEKTIHDCKDKRMFQILIKSTNKYDGIYKNEKEKLPQHVNRAYASYENVGYTLRKKKLNSNVMSKIAYCPPYCIVDNDESLHKEIESYINKDWYIDECRRRLKSFTSQNIQTKLSDFEQ